MEKYNPFTVANVNQTTLLKHILKLGTEGESNSVESA
jgi:hypothetical protein